MLLTLAVTAHAEAAGDVNCDGIVDAADVATLVANIFADPQADCPTADVTGDGHVDSADMVELMGLLSPPLAPGPRVTFFGLAGADGVAENPLGEIAGSPVYFRTAGFGFKLVVEGKTGSSGEPPGLILLNADPHDASRRPDLQLESSNAVGDGSKAVCSGGVPAVAPPDFGDSQSVADALNDFACNFVSATSPNFACTLDEFGDSGFLTPDSRVQFCLQVQRLLTFPQGETVLTVQLRDVAGNLGPQEQLILRVGNGPVPSTFTPTSTVTTTPTRAPTATRTATVPRTSTRTPTANGMPATPSRSPTSTTAVTPGTRTATPTRTRTATSSRTPASTSTATRTPKPTPTVTPTIAGPTGPVITYFGITTAPGELIPPSDMTPERVPIYAPEVGAGFQIVVEGKPQGRCFCPNPCCLGKSSYQQDLTSFPDLQIEVSQQLGNGSAAVCDDSGRTPGGVPATDPPSFEPTQANINAVNDLACRFVDGMGFHQGIDQSDEACVTHPPSDEYGFADPTSTMEFCALVGRVLHFPDGDTVLTARLRDRGGNVGPTAQIIIRVVP